MLGQLKTLSVFVTVVVLQFSLFAVAWDWQATFYSGEDATGYSADVVGRTSATCVTLNNRRLCNEQSSCVNLTTNSSSVDTMGSCVRLYRTKNCEGNPVMELRPGTLCHRYWGQCGIVEKFNSVGGCGVTDENFDQNTEDIMPAPSLTGGTISSPNYPEKYPSNENKNWIITVPYGMKVKIMFETLDMEYSESCKKDKLTISELVSNQKLFEGCGTKMPGSPLVSRSNQVRINFVSDSSKSGGGFSLQWTRCEECEVPSDILRPTIAPPPPPPPSPPSPRPPPDSSSPCNSDVPGNCPSADIPEDCIEFIDLDRFEVYDPSRSKKRETPKVHFYTFAKKDKGATCYLGETYMFSKEGKHLIYTHGYTTPVLKDGTDIKDAVFQGTTDVNTVTLVDWRNLSYPFPDCLTNPSWAGGRCGAVSRQNYETVVYKNLPIVEEKIRQFIIDHLLQKNAYLVGFSLGAQLSGTVARNIKKTTSWAIPRITGLDPAGPIFDHQGPLNQFTINKTNTLNKTDAIFVDVVHVDLFNNTGGFQAGMVSEAGHLDIYMYETGCRSGNPANIPKCTHHKAVEAYIASLITCSLISCPTNRVTRPGLLNSQSKCDTDDAKIVSSLGYLADLYGGRGRQEVYLYSVGYLSVGICSTFRDVRLPAKRRICRAAGNCPEGKPYLSKCTACRRAATCTAESGNRRVTWRGQVDCAAREMCKEEDGAPVEYWIAYKLNKGGEYVVILPQQDGGYNPVQRGKYQVNDTRSVFGQTLRSIYGGGKSDVNYVLWNDDIQDIKVSGSSEENNDSDEDRKVENGGRAKGVLAFAPTSGFLLLHSIPNFPSVQRGVYEYPEAAFKNAQIAVCVSLTNEQEERQAFLLESLIHHMHSIVPTVYSSKIDGSLTRMSPRLSEQLTQLVNSPKNWRDPQTSVPEVDELLISFQPKIKIHFLESSKSNTSLDMYEYLADYYDTDLIARTGNNKVGTGKLPPSCDGPYHVENVNEITLEGRRIRRTRDSSNWAISKPSRNPNQRGATCIGDLGRSNSTKGRGGMFICIRDKNVHGVFRSFKPVIRERDKCR